MKNKSLKIIAITLFSGLTLMLGCKQADKKTEETKSEVSVLTAEEATKIGVEGVVYGMPLVIMDLTKNVSTNVAGPEPDAHAPINQFGNMAAYPPATDHSVVRMNVDTLYSWGWLDLSDGPVVVTIPDTGDRYYLMPLVDAWTNVFASPGKRTGIKAGNFVITGPGWKGDTPEGMTVYKSPTSMVWTLGRTQANGPKDYPAVHKIQDGYKITPLSAWGTDYTAPAGVVNPNINMDPPIKQLEAMSTTEFFNALTELMVKNPAYAEDAPVLEKLAMIGVVPGEKFDLSKLDPAVAKALENVVPMALGKLKTAPLAAPVDGWEVPPAKVADAGTDYGLRAVVAMIGLGANITADAIYPNAFEDADGNKLNGENNYVLHFDKGETPPTNSFWSLTMYNAESFFVENPINRYNIAGWMPLKYNDDGSLDVYIQKESPGKAKESNWLPAAAGTFSVTLRVYWPKETMIDGSWKTPGIKMVKE
ncbi:DUF1254 domain-containing protein [Formosa sp. PL04]|uniref:DUF1254 domain-containing protein n=1 Tax=Formosa sp. PL04 TaxID=3081755 RepID=UPI0029827BED|nr:DUF1254 domain-containing protein [Formosa sp. PL04]MDW5288924.1 DUF1254 domain-containing protein [Formosa sp. PL04]